MIRQHLTSQQATVLIGQDDAIVSLRKDIARVARLCVPVLILGETGTGKETVARLIHTQSPRRNEPLITVNCGGIPETSLDSELFGQVRGSFTSAMHDRRGLVEQADGGTLFLDEVGELSPRMQAALLRFTDTGECQHVGADGPDRRVDVRLVAATRRDLWARVADGVFREDLFFRLNVITLSVPPLRARPRDIVVLTRHCLEQAAVAHGRRVPALSPEAIRVLCAYGWPGNVRELRNVAERLVLQDYNEPLVPADLQVELRQGATAVRR